MMSFAAVQGGKPDRLLNVKCGFVEKRLAVPLWHLQRLLHIYGMQQAGVLSAI